MRSEYEPNKLNCISIFPIKNIHTDKECPAALSQYTHTRARTLVIKYLLAYYYISCLLVLIKHILMPYYT